ncbi:MAG: hypothetical protein C6P37_11735 [Caldibacillus debilis]|jgi:hypothetical protein|uniref:Uncharacterized protein n=1 Tax=Caldibacillus debilis TaxID=301148 RepID=A0A3E0K3K5_9BACI|nr:MAG: hypothetical protein C6P37_11735 [Caldibacillus debilis]
MSANRQKEKRENNEDENEEDLIFFYLFHSPGVSTGPGRPRDSAFPVRQGTNLRNKVTGMRREAPSPCPMRYPAPMKREEH